MEWNMSRTPPWEVNQREDLDVDVEREKGKDGNEGENADNRSLCKCKQRR